MNKNKEYCKYLKIYEEHGKLIEICQVKHNHCNQLCAFFIAYNKEIV